jgi:hypothetical protein
MTFKRQKGIQGRFQRGEIKGQRFESSFQPKKFDYQPQNRETDGLTSLARAGR